MKLKYLKSAQITKEDLISNFKIKKEIEDLEKVIEYNPKIVLTDKTYNIGSKKFKLLKRTSSVFFSSNIVRGIRTVFYLYRF